MNKRIKNMLARAGSAAGPESRAGRSGFTLIELLIAVGALAFVAVGVAAIFEATGRTIQGGKRVSAFSAYASLIERQMRADIESMTREGFLVIRNELADGNGDGTPDPLDPSDMVALTDDDSRPRPRRIDELMFFSKGQFVSMREALHPSVTARSDAARIYYGHAKEDTLPATTLRQLDDQNDDDSASLGYRNNPANPNRLASEWTLLRHVTLLCPPDSATPVIDPPRVFGVTFNPGNQQHRDSDTQIAFQPAASSVFRALAAQYPGTVSAFRTEYPQFCSGLVDIATTDLREIRSIVMTADVAPGPGIANFYDPANNAGSDGSNNGVDGIYRGTWADIGVTGRAQQWMSDALPTWSTVAGSTRQRVRIRCEPAPRDFVGALVDAPNEVQRSLRRGDQLMLSSSNFLPRCTEFIVEWSFGDTWTSDSSHSGYDAARAGEIVWHGMERRVNGEVVTQFYMYNQYPWDVQPSTPFTRINGTKGSHAAGGVANCVELIHGEGFSIPAQAGDPNTQLLSYFGYIDPTFNPDSDNDNKLESPNDSVSPTIPWPWPKLIRVTLSLADPNDPLIERTFQFVFEVPPAPES